jgi:hypothetical protein
MNIISKFAEVKNYIFSLRTKLILYAILALLTIGGAFIIYNEYINYKKIKLELSIEKGNVKAYENIVGGLENDKRVLTLSAVDLRHSNDKMVNTINSLRKSLKLPENKPGDVTVGTTTSMSVIDIVIIQNPCDFKLDTTINYNELTSNSIKIEKDSLISSIKVNNSETLFVYTSREYVNGYKNGWIRFWHFDWKKEDIERYEINNSNKLIKVDSVRVIKTR